MTNLVILRLNGYYRIASTNSAKNERENMRCLLICPTLKISNTKMAKHSKKILHSFMKLVKFFEIV